jgi:O-antigen ligase
MSMWHNPETKNILRDVKWSVLPILLAVVLGLVLGAMMILRRSLSDKWAGALVMAVIGIVFVLLLGDLKKTILLALVVDIPLSLDVAIRNHGDHSGGPTGFTISLATFALIAGYADWIVNHRPRLRLFQSITAPALFFLFAAILSIFQSVNVELSLFSIFMIFQFLLMLIYLVNNVTSPEDLRFILNTLALCLLVEGMFMIVQYFTGASLSFAGIESRSMMDLSASVEGVRVAGTIGSPNAAASYLAPTLAIVFGAYLTNGRLVNRTLALTAFGVGTVALILTSVRSGWISFAVAMAVLIIQAAKIRSKRRAIFILLVFVVIVGIVFSQRIVNRFTRDDSDSAESREWLAEMARNIIRAHPLGVGINNYDQVMSYRYAPSELIGHRLYVVHNKYLLVWADTGALGLAAFVWLLIAAGAQGAKWIVRPGAPPHSSVLVASLVGALAGYSINMTNEAFGGRLREQLLWLIITLIVIATQFITTTSSNSAPDTRSSGVTSQ